jgi:hypothetical protein
MNRFKGRPARGLPGDLPEGEAVLWQGAPDWLSLAKHAFRVRPIAVYFGLLITWRIGIALVNGHGLGFAAASGLSGLLLGAAATGLFCVFAWLMSRTTVYTITNKRVVITYGMALPKSLNLPYSRIDAANVLVHADGTGDIALKLPAKTKLSYLLLWPHVRSGTQNRNEPVLRCISDAANVAAVLGAVIGGAPAKIERATVTARPVDNDLLGARAA